ncbi:MAG: NADPH:quinone oxidoreductase family protein [Actinomycetota bacterium]|nr:MAG: NADPH:quinone oxidoreductase family protein [Actinomycetota bacterium]
MLAAQVPVHGDPEVIQILEIPDPVPGAGEVVVDVVAAGVNFPDVLVVANKYQVSIEPPFVPGTEYAGIVRSVGSDVTQWRPGDRVHGWSMVGAFAEQICVPADRLSRLPDGVGFGVGATYYVPYLTAQHSLRSVADVQPGEWVCVLGAAGGVGLATIELAQTMGARVIAAASSTEKLQLCLARGASHAIDYVADDLRDRLKEITGRGADVVIDPVGGRWSERAIRATAFGGRFVTVGYASGEIPRIPLNLVLLKGLAILGIDMRTFSTNAPDRYRRDVEELEQTLISGHINPQVGDVWPLRDVPTALRRVADRLVLGKTIVHVAPEVPLQI